MIALQGTDNVLGMADWVELSILHDNLKMSKAKFANLVFPDNDPDQEDAESEALYDSVVMELKRRVKLYGHRPPYTISGNIVTPRYSWQEVPELFMCLLFAYWGAYNVHVGTKLFERLSNEVLASYLDGTAVTLGFPNNDTLKTQIDHLAEILYETRGNEDPLHTDKDRGVDVIGWKSFNDNRSGQIIVLMQCAAGRNWAQKKGVPLSNWTHYIHWNCYTAIQSISVTEIITAEKWKHRLHDYGIVFDRARIYQNLYKQNRSVNLPLRTEITNWCTNILLTK